MLDSTMPYYQLGLGNRLWYGITFIDFDQVIASSEPKPDARYEITGVSLEYESVTQPDLMALIVTEYQSMALQYERILRNRQIPVNKSDTRWSWSFNTPCKSLSPYFCLKWKSHTNETRAAFTVLR